MSTAIEGAPFHPRTVLLIVGAAVIAFAAFLALIAFAPDFRSGHDARGHALSTSGNGYAGLVALTDALGSHSLIVREPGQLSTSALLIVTPETDSDPAALRHILAARNGHPTLIILPKWSTLPLKKHPGWTQAFGLIDPAGIQQPLKLLPHVFAVAQSPFRKPAAPMPSVPRLVRARIGSQAEQQRLDGLGIVPMLVDADGRIVLARFARRPVYLLAEPDLLDNQGLADRWTARQGWQVIDDLMTDNELAFDITLNGFATQKSPLRLALQPPLLPVTLCIVAAALLAGLHGAIRFGAPLDPERAIAFGKRTLVDNAAQLFRAARKEHRVGGAYATLTRDLTAQAAGAPGRLTGEALDDWLDRAGVGADDAPYATLAWHAQVAEDRDQLLGAARALYRWRRNRTR